MCKHALHEFLAALPKCEHHMHLEGSLSPELLFELSERNNVALPSVTEDPAFASVAALYERYANFTSLDDFLHYYYIGFTVLTHESDFEALAYAYFAKAAGQGLRHAEVFFDPQVHINRGIAYETVVSGFTKARRRAEADLGVTSLLIPCLLRHLPVPDSLSCLSAIRDAGHFRDGTLAGLGLCSTERDHPPSMWKEAFALAGSDGARLTAHAGEEGPPAYITEALDELAVTRIDHGVNARLDEAVMARLARDRVMLSVCPLSNVVLRGVTKVSEVPIRTFLDRGVPFSINSDDPAYFGGYILDNYCAVQDAFDLSVAEWGTIATNAVQGSWCGEERKGELIREIEALVAEWKNKVTA
ncbi:hypothetical protein VPNG_08776 [Cytospora leucostoma]|uniref:Adenine deaminase n=1 Tax=Cytospora leucostoma TaxID=1230097 RepID=A0A423VXH3_9PEZI|nr:hypothetical protein VPNG_08776 [Cytospora leucostoma]